MQYEYFSFINIPVYIFYDIYHPSPSHNINVHYKPKRTISDKTPAANR